MMIHTSTTPIVNQLGGEQLYNNTHSTGGGGAIILQQYLPGQHQSIINWGRERSIISLSGRGILNIPSICLSEAAVHQKIPKTVPIYVLIWAIPATLRMAKINRNRNLCAPKLNGTHNWLTPWCYLMSDPSSSQQQQYTTSLTYTRYAWAGGTFFPVVLLCQFSVLAGNRFLFYIPLMYLEYHTVVVMC
jgi:hypothetical protein